MKLKLSLSPLAFAAVSMDTESFDDALAQYQAVLLVEPQNKSAISGLCVLAVQQNRRAEAQALYARIQASGGVDETDPPPGWRICEQAIRAMSP